MQHEIPAQCLILRADQLPHPALDRAIAEHEAIVTALKKRDAAAAATAMESHLDAVMAELVDVADRNPDAVALPAGNIAAA